MNRTPRPYLRSLPTVNQCFGTGPNVLQMFEWICPLYKDTSWGVIWLDPQNIYLFPPNLRRYDWMDVYRQKSFQASFLFTGWFMSFTIFFMGCWLLGLPYFMPKKRACSTGGDVGGQSSSRFSPSSDRSATFGWGWSWLVLPGSLDQPPWGVYSSTLGNCKHRGIMEKTSHMK